MGVQKVERLRMGRTVKYEKVTRRRAKWAMLDMGKKCKNWVLEQVCISV